MDNPFTSKDSIFFSGRSWLDRCLAGIRTLILPERCMSCGGYLQIGSLSDELLSDEPLAVCFCRTCLALPLPAFSPPFCPVCGHLFPVSDQESHLCEACLTSAPAVAKVRAAFSYEGVVRSVVAQFKYKGRLRLARPLEHHLFDAFARHFGQDKIDLILPVPLHPGRAWERQFNQAVLLTRRFPRLFRRRFGRAPSWSVRPDLLVRKRATESQTGLAVKEREKNLKGAFAVTSGDAVKGKHVLLVDDVYTSGATCRAAAESLFRAGAVVVNALVLARA